MIENLLICYIFAVPVGSSWLINITLCVKEYCANIEIVQWLIILVWSEKSSKMVLSENATLFVLVLPYVI